MSATAEAPEIVQRLLAFARRLYDERGRAHAPKHFHLNPQDWDEVVGHYTGYNFSGRKAFPSWPVFTLETDLGTLHLHSSHAQREGCFVAAGAPGQDRGDRGDQPVVPGEVQVHGDSLRLLLALAFALGYAIAHR